MFRFGVTDLHKCEVTSVVCQSRIQVILRVLRFGETDLHKCEVMLKDVADSKRINTNIAERKELAHKRTGTVVEEVTSS